MKTACISNVHAACVMKIKFDAIERRYIAGNTKLIIKYTAWNCFFFGLEYFTKRIHIVIASAYMCEPVNNTLFEPSIRFCIWLNSKPFARKSRP